MAMITDADDYFLKGCGRCARFATPDCSVQRWVGGLKHLRRICLDMGLQETVKWGHPTYIHAGRNIALFGALRGDFRLSFMNAGLLTDKDGLLEPAGPNSATPAVLRFTDAAQAAGMEPAIRDFLRQLMDHAEAGTKPPKAETRAEMPEELAEALDSDPELAEAFHALTPGRQKSYVFAIGQAKQSATRIARIAKFRDRILAGKGAMER
ncbi:YdeI/OmpD-associated family protein [Szabonella alba]|uniref:YdeI/OmpD-associated family protein n=1 Tax=Szabonella alba TaxID=2804194 RepID=A0A8K0VFQ1_9RHOB|nr:YdeI/OmpD-associated family protein [Szabonella alba]MBL4918492.1 YdeI/OmpD-associated family protein [Szabonella alba]